MNDILVAGLGVMGRSIAQNMMRNGFKVAGYNRTFAVTQSLMGLENFTGYEHLEEAIASLSSPKKVFLMVPAGPVVDKMIEVIKPLLKAGDIIMDGGNSYFEDDRRRAQLVADQGIHYLAVGVSGGEMGALWGPSIMPSGPKEAYEQVAPILEKIAAQKEGQPCCTYIGPEGSGHYVKMVHNGIEYADMQLIVECYLYLKAAGLSNAQISDVFKEWNQGPMESYLLGITVKILLEKDPQSSDDLVDRIKDASSNKGTGKWTSQVALSQDVNVSLIHAAYMARLTSNLEKRNLLVPVQPSASLHVEELKKAYYLARIVAYEQGWSLYADASQRYGWNLDLAKIALIFRAGCIIQATLLNDIAKIVNGHDTLLAGFSEVVQTNLPALKKIVTEIVNGDIPMPLFMAALAYLLPFQGAGLGANLIQAQRDFFGAHTFERIDQDGSFHHEWE